jgi:hypothetical protein
MEGACWDSLPPDMQFLILDQIPLLKLAQVACLCKDIKAVYDARVALREKVIDSLPRAYRVLIGIRTCGVIQETRPASVGALLDSLPLSATALPRDLVGIPEV